MIKQSKYAQVPKVSAANVQGLQRFIDTVTRNLNMMTGSSSDSVLTKRSYQSITDLNAKLSKQVNSIGNRLSELDGSLNPGDVEFPTIPTGVIGQAALTNIMITWDNPSYKGHAYTEILFNPEDKVAEAKPIGNTPYPVFIHPVALLSKGYYWVRHVNAKKQFGPVHSTEGLFVEASQSPEDLLKLLSDSIADDDFISDDLQDRIDIIDTTPIGDHFGLIDLTQALADADAAITETQVLMQSSIDALDEMLHGIDGIAPRLDVAEAANDILQGAQSRLDTSLSALSERISGEGGVEQKIIAIQAEQDNSASVIAGVKTTQMKCRPL